MAVVGRKKSNRNCAAFNCANCYSNRPDLSFFRFPRDPDRYVLLRAILYIFCQMCFNVLKTSNSQLKHFTLDFVFCVTVSIACLVSVNCGLLFLPKRDQQR